MPVSYQFIKAPEINYGARSVLLLLEDYCNIMELVEKQLNSPPPNNGFPQNVNQLYIDRLMIDNRNLGPNQQLTNQQVQLNASFANALSKIAQISDILKTSAGQKLGNDPLQCLSARLGNFKTATRLFTTRTCMPKTAVAAEFHAACDGKPNAVVIIKSGQYIAGGFTALAFESPASGHYKADPNFSTFLFSLNRQKLYPLKKKDKAILCNKDLGPYFGNYYDGGVCIQNNYANSDNFEVCHSTYSSFYDSSAVEGELFGTVRFAADEYEVFQLQ